MSSSKAIGLLPAAGSATRLNGISKYALPIPGGSLIGRHVEEMRLGGVEYVNVACSEASVHIVAQCVPETFRFICKTRTMSETAIWARPYCGMKNVLFGMPDTYWSTEAVYIHLKYMLDNDIDLALAVWRIRKDQVGKVGQVYFNGLNRVQAVVDKDPDCPFPWAWAAMAWKPAFWDCIDPATPHVGYAAAEALKRGLKVFAMPVEGEHFNIGTLADYYECLQSFEGELA